MNNETIEKKLRWAIAQRLKNYDKVEYSDENMARIENEISRAISNISQDPVIIKFRKEQHED